MLDNFVTFEGAQNGKVGEKVRVTLGPNRTFLLSRAAWEAMGSPEAVELAFDAIDRKVALRPCPPERRNAFRVVKKSTSSYRVIHAGAFLTHFKIRPPHTLLFDSPEITPERTMILDLQKTTRVGRGSR